MSSYRHIPDFLRIAALVVVAALLASCGGSQPQKLLNAEQRFANGKKLYDERNYLEAIAEFDVIRLQFPGSTIADQAQYYLGQSHFHLDEFLLAAEEFQQLKRNMPASPLVPSAQYYIALCYYNLAPKSQLDQSYTSRAIDEFQSFIEYYPKNEHVQEAEDKINELNGRLAKKLFDSAELYMKMGSYQAAVMYYTSVVEKYHDTQYAEPALLGKVRALVARKKYKDAKPDIDKFLEKYPASRFKADAESLQKLIDNGGARM
ncbi:MAG TPA: outer membrane protein assembly factor BamD [Bacteroidota bacterium]|nr:outer membrane protein assembly factor BamD [Bacteroidota bacterium]